MNDKVTDATTFLAFNCNVTFYNTSMDDVTSLI